MNKKKEKKVLFSVAVALAVIGSLLLSYGVYSSQIQTLTGETFTSSPTSFELDNLNPIPLTLYKFNKVDFDQNAIDQIQNDVSGPGILIGSTQYGMQVIRQTGLNEREPWNGFQIIVDRHGSPSKPLYIGIRDNIDYSLDPNGPYDLLAYLPASALPKADTYYLVGLDTQIPGITSNDAWAITLFSEQSGLENYWSWGATNQNPYPRGETQSWDYNQQKWLSHSAGIMDTGFITFTVPSDDPPDELPEITISTTSAVIPMAFGIFSLIGAAVTGVRYFMIGV